MTKTEYERAIVNAQYNVKKLESIMDAMCDDETLTDAELDELYNKAHNFRRLMWRNAR